MLQQTWCKIVYRRNRENTVAIYVDIDMAYIIKKRISDSPKRMILLPFPPAPWIIRRVFWRPKTPMESAMCGCGSKCLGDVSAFNRLYHKRCISIFNIFNSTLFFFQRSRIFTYVLPWLSACNHLLWYVIRTFMILSRFLVAAKHRHRSSATEGHDSSISLCPG